MGAYNTVEELIEAHLSNQRIRLSHTEYGRAILRKIGCQIEPVPVKVALSEDWKTIIRTKPFPWNMTPGKDDDRRTARAKAMARKPEANPRVMYADVSLRKHSDRAAVVVTFIDRLIFSVSMRTKDPATAEEVAVALAIIHPSVETMVTDSKTANRSFCGEVISSVTRAIQSKYKPQGRAVELVWFPAHSQVAGNTTPDYHAREMPIGPSMSRKSYHTRLPAFGTLPRSTEREGSYYQNRTST
ncbi:hypothetical protein HPB51_024464 [Rhipicephalus microplus]|uniref:Tick transposon n=1 Tax=Rhipicephalus microplus TaxID=6941 RepID=A0A9J6EV25_RHIMP|nr:hypothetical protein HPB51_024464 [Rhipicephalus microplus]